MFELVTAITAALTLLSVTRQDTDVQLFGSY